MPSLAIRAATFSASAWLGKAGFGGKIGGQETHPVSGLAFGKMAVLRHDEAVDACWLGVEKCDIRDRAGSGIIPG